MSEALKQLADAQLAAWQAFRDALTPAPPPVTPEPFVASFTVKPDRAPPGAMVEVAFDVLRASTVTITGPTGTWTGRATDSFPSRLPAAPGTYQFTLAAVGPSGTANAERTVLVETLVPPDERFAIRVTPARPESGQVVQFEAIERGTLL